MHVRTAPNVCICFVNHSSYPMQSWKWANVPRNLVNTAPRSFAFDKFVFCGDIFEGELCCSIFLLQDSEMISGDLFAACSCLAQVNSNPKTNISRIAIRDKLK